MMMDCSETDSFTTSSIDDMSLAGDSFVQWRTKRKTTDVLESRKRIRGLTTKTSLELPTSSIESTCHFTNANSLLAAPVSEMKQLESKEPLEDNQVQVEASDCASMNQSIENTNGSLLSITNCTNSEPVVNKTIARESINSGEVESQAIVASCSRPSTSSNQPAMPVRSMLESLAAHNMIKNRRNFESSSLDDSDDEYDYEGDSDCDDSDELCSNDENYAYNEYPDEDDYDYNQYDFYRDYEDEEDIRMARLMKSALKRNSLEDNSDLSASEEEEDF